MDTKNKTCADCVFISEFGLCANQDSTTYDRYVLGELACTDCELIYPDKNVERVVVDDVDPASLCANCTYFDSEYCTNAKDKCKRWGHYVKLNLVTDCEGFTPIKKEEKTSNKTEQETPKHSPSSKVIVKSISLGDPEKTATFLGYYLEEDHFLCAVVHFDESPPMRLHLVHLSRVKSA